MKHSSISVFFFLLFSLVSCHAPGDLDIYGTTDLHGMLLPFDNTDGVATDHSLANLASIVEFAGNENIVLLDNGDILQGDPLTYYYNFVDTTGLHIVPDVLNYLGYDAATIGNHDIETGHAVYDRVRKEYNFPLLAANAVDVRTGDPYFTPYTVVKKKGFKVIIFGLITPSVPDWLPESLYKGIRFEDMVETAAKWMPKMKAENPDIIIGLFHSGYGYPDNSGKDENSTLAVAVNVPGFDLIMAGHDHNVENKTITNIEGKPVVILDGGSRANNLMHAKITFPDRADSIQSVRISGKIIPMNTLVPSSSFVARYAKVMDLLRSYTSRVIGQCKTTISTRDSYFGPSAFIDLIHTIQLDITGADISFAAPLSFDEAIKQGDIKVSDMFRLYRFENFLYKVKMTGKEIDKYLEHSYGLWYSTMDDNEDYLLKYRLDDHGEPALFNGKARLRNPSYSFDSAMGMKYTVDVREKEGNRVSILSLADGSPFFPDSSYAVAVNSYRANGGGGHFEAAGITHDILPERLISATDRDLRYYMTEWITEKEIISPVPCSEWTIVPENWVSIATKRETGILFSDK